MRTPVQTKKKLCKFNPWLWVFIDNHNSNQAVTMLSFVDFFTDQWTLQEEEDWHSHL